MGEAKALRRPLPADGLKIMMIWRWTKRIKLLSTCSARRIEQARICLDILDPKLSHHPLHGLRIVSVAWSRLAFELARANASGERMAQVRNKGGTSWLVCNAIRRDIELVSTNKDVGHDHCHLLRRPL